MFKSLSERLNHSLQKIKGQGRLTDDNIKSALRDVRMALLEADVALPVVKNFIEDLRQQVVGEKVKKSLTPGQTFISIVKKSLEELLGGQAEPLDLKSQPPVVILMAGLQGAGKTTTTGKLANYLKTQQKKRVAVVSTDIYRPAAIDQLETVASEVGAEFVPSNTQQKPSEIAKNAIQQAKESLADVLIIDTAGRLHVDATMMDEITTLQKVANPTETLFVVDSMAGQDAANTAKVFNEALTLTGVILTKVDGDARGGAALSIRQVTGKPIKMIGTGEKSDALEPFYPDRIASRILGMGDLLSLIESAEQTSDEEKAAKLERKLKKGKSFTLDDFKQQLEQMQKMGGAKSLLEKMPGSNKVPNDIQEKAGEAFFKKTEAMINSMTPKERRKPEIIKSSRKRRIVAGSGTTVQDLNKLLKQFAQMQKMMKTMRQKGGMRKMMGAMKDPAMLQQMMGGKGGGRPF